MEEHPKLKMVNYIYSRPTYSQAMGEYMEEFLRMLLKENGGDVGEAAGKFERQAALVVKDFRKRQEDEEKRKTRK